MEEHNVVDATEKLTALTENPNPLATTALNLSPEMVLVRERYSLGGLGRETTTTAQFVKHFGQYGEITDSVIMKDRRTGQPRGFGLVTYADPSVVDKVMEDAHCYKWKRPSTITGHQKITCKVQAKNSGLHVREHGFGFITVDTEQVVDDLLADGNKLEFAETASQVEIKKAEPKKPNAAPPPPKRQVCQELHKVLWKRLESLVSSIKRTRKLKQNHYEALYLVERLCSVIREGEGNGIDVIGPHFISAVRNGIFEVVEKMLEVFPELITHRDNGKNALRLAVEYRHGRVFSILHKRIKQHEVQGGALEREVIYKQFCGKCFLHLVAKRPRRNRLEAGSRTVLQMHLELQWYKEMQKLLPPQLLTEKNDEGKLAIDVFDEEHQDMVKSEGEWIISIANSCIVGGSLIAAVVFAAAISVPGGNKENNGLPNFSKERAFEVFLFSDTLALVSSLTAVVIFLSIFTTRYSVNDILHALPKTLIVGIISLLLSVTFMMIAFSATVYLLLAKDYQWIIYPTVAVSFIPVMFFGYLQLPALIRMIKSTYRHDIFKLE